MSHEFKFRVWSFLEKSFYYFTLDEGIPQGIAGGVSEPQQYTGCHDSANKEIYEGDIIIDTQKQKYEIIFDENYARYDIKVCGENKLRGHTSYGTEIYEKKHIEVIGNIFENPELLKTI